MNRKWVLAIIVFGGMGLAVAASMVTAAVTERSFHVPFIFLAMWLFTVAGFVVTEAWKVR